MKAPSPPFPDGAWFVCLGDAAGSLLEVLPWGFIQDENAGVKRSDEPMTARTSTHVLLQTARSQPEIERIAAEEGWSCRPTNAGLFQFTKVWIDGTFLIELMTPEQAKSYTTHFGAAGIAQLDGKLRDLERGIREKMGSRT